MEKLILASASPRRSELLRQVGLSFSIHPSTVNEEEVYEEDPILLVELLAQMKARQVAEELGEGIVLGADTIVVLGQEVLGKPQDDLDALRMLRKLQGTRHQVVTAVSLVDWKNKKEVVGSRITQVSFRSASEEELVKYIASGEPKDKAGAYAIQGLGALFVSEINGCYYNVVGLPLQYTASLLKEFGISVLA